MYDIVNYYQRHLILCTKITKHPYTIQTEGDFEEIPLPGVRDIWLEACFIKAVVTRYFDPTW